MNTRNDAGTGDMAFARRVAAGLAGIPTYLVAGELAVSAPDHRGRLRRSRADGAVICVSA